ncbi:hypothetical protein OIU85_013755 [Salix viminalis]|uniref:Uncharacterized protein n=1 Tax=Salix viminalis TaxID=40686 RepID=A0A9Q0NMA4_SALVM|nr:hypothetical protein OIU85_013755 [Salix viminalis]
MLCGYVSVRDFGSGFRCPVFMVLVLGISRALGFWVSHRGAVVSGFRVSGRARFSRLARFASGYRGSGFHGLVFRLGICGLGYTAFRFRFAFAVSVLGRGFPEVSGYRGFVGFTDGFLPDAGALRVSSGSRLRGLGFLAWVSVLRGSVSVARVSFGFPPRLSVSWFPEVPLRVGVPRVTGFHGIRFQPARDLVVTAGFRLSFRVFGFGVSQLVCS